jgi:hypothetical protein
MTTFCEVFRQNLPALSKRKSVNICFKEWKDTQEGRLVEKAWTVSSDIKEVVSWLHKMLSKLQV